VLTNYRVRGLVIRNTRTDLPIKKGLSSSAAICVLTARAFNRVYDLRLTVRGEMELAYQGEITTPSRCGRMDQGCAFGDRAVLMEFDADRLETEEIRPPRDLHFVIVDLQAKKDTVEILRRLNRSYPFAEGPVEKGVQELLGPINKRIVHQAIEALRAGDAFRLGALMTEAQAFFDRYATPACPEELTAPVLHRVLAHEALRPHVWGGKGVGSQATAPPSSWRGARPTSARWRRSSSETRVDGPPADARHGSEGPEGPDPRGRLRNPALSGEQGHQEGALPVVDRDGIAKPAILLIVEEASTPGSRRW